MNEKRALLMILDGWGRTTDPAVSASAQAHTPFIDRCFKEYPHAELQASEEAVGLPRGQMGNSEVGHMNLGAGRVVYQNLARINKAIREGTLQENPVLKEQFREAQKNKRKIHFIGLLSEGGVHSHIDHLKALLQAAQHCGLERVFVHAFTDGRDTDPKSGLSLVSDIQAYMTRYGGELASLVGRYYAMDRDKRWERIKVAYDLLTQGKAEKTLDLQAAIQASYDQGITDEFIKPLVLTDACGRPKALIETGDLVICYNFRTDRARQLTQVLTQRDLPRYDMRKLDLRYCSMTRYEADFKNVRVLFENQDIDHTLGEVLARAHKTQVRIAETEKYPHVTFFFNGGREAPFEGEKRILVPSPKVATYDLKPEMSAFEVRDKAVAQLERRSADFICLNFANPDMVGHTGVFKAAVKACEVTDSCAEAVTEAALKNGYAVIILADHGNAELMVKPDGSPHTAHTTARVPCFLLTGDKSLEIRDGKLGDIAPTLLQLLGLSTPQQMSGENLIAHQ